MIITSPWYSFIQRYFKSNYSQNFID